MRPSLRLAAIITTLTFTSGVFAQPKPATLPKKPATVREQLPDAAKRAWDNGMELLRSKDCRGALPEFKRAWEISNNPRTLFNAALCEKDLGHYSKAVQLFEQELADGASILTTEEKSELTDAINVVKRFVSTVEIVTNEPDATLFIDDIEISGGKTPFLKPVPIDVGAGRVLKLKKDGFKEAVVTMDVSAGQPARATFKLEQLVKRGIANVTIAGVPQANLFIDDREVGVLKEGTSFRAEVTTESHTFEARAVGYVSARKTETIGSKETRSITLVLSAERHVAKVRVVASPPGSTIEIDGRAVGTTTWEGLLARGGHQLTVKKSGFETKSQELALDDDQVRSIPVTLSESKSTWVWWAAGTLAVVGGATAISFMVFKPADQPAFVGSFQPGIVPGSFRH